MKHPLFRLGSILILQALLAGAASAQYLELSAGRFHSLALRCDGTVEAWGANMSGQTDVPPLPTGLACLEVAAGGAPYDVWWSQQPVSYAGLSLARRSDGAVVAWGDNSLGQLNVPSLPLGLSYLEVAAGGRHGLARRSDGEVVAWGDNSYGQCNVPALPQGMVYTQVSAGGWDSEIWDYTYLFGPDIVIVHLGHSVALRSDGAVVTWGDSSYGLDRVPPLPTGLTYVEVSAGSNHMAARLSDGSVVAWGDNTFGQCNVPVLPLGVSYASIDAGGGVTTARLSDGSVASWGLTSPAVPTSSLDIVAVTTGGTASSAYVIPIYPGAPYETYGASSHSIAIRSDGSLMGWGANSNGQATVPAGWSFENLGLGLPGPAGVPTLTGTVDCPTGTGQPITLTLERAPANSPSILVIGLSHAGLPLLGGTLVPSPDLLLFGQTDPVGSQSLSYAVPTGFPSGQALFGQFWVLAPELPGSPSASNGIALTAP